MEKKIICLAVVLIMLALLSRVVLSADIKVIFNGTELATDVAPEIVKDRVVLPMRAVFEALGARVDWFGNDGLIFAMKGDTMITLKIGSNEMTVQKAAENEYRKVTLDVAPFIKNNRTLVPVRAVSEALKANVEWNNESRTVTINSK